MAVDPDSVGAASKIAEWLFEILLGLAASIASFFVWLHKGLMHRISVLENTAVRKEDFKIDQDRAERSRQELRQGIIDLHQKVEKSAHDLADKVDKVIDYLLKDKK